MEQSLLIFTAQYLIILPLVISGLYFLYQPLQKKKTILIFGIATSVVTGLLALIGGYLYYDPRPFVIGHFIPLLPHSPDNGFPSDHVLLTSTLAVIFPFYNRKLAVSLWLITFLVAYSRVYVGVHHPIDVMGSMIMAIMGSFVAYKIINYRKQQKYF
jgi:undecaprenyl-diphosphatase